MQNFNIEQVLDFFAIPRKEFRIPKHIIVKIICTMIKKGEETAKMSILAKAGSKLVTTRGPTEYASDHLATELDIIVLK